MKSLTILSLFCIFNVACKKNYTCECVNNNGTYIAGEIEGTKRNANKKCSALNTSNSNCKIK